METKTQSASVVEIDPLALDKECIKQPSLILQAATTLADIRERVSELKAELDVLEADLQRRIRATPIKYGCDEKVTEKAIASAVILQESYREKQGEIRSCQHRAELAAAMVEALDHKKRSLTLLVELHGMGYFGEVKTSIEGRDAVKDKSKKDLYDRQQRKLRDD